MLGDLCRQAYEAMIYNRRRTTVTIVGMAWGIATVVLLLAYGSGFGRAVDFAAPGLCSGGLLAPAPDRIRQLSQLARGVDALRELKGLVCIRAMMAALLLRR